MAVKHLRLTSLYARFGVNLSEKMQPEWRRRVGYVQARRHAFGFVS
jgi:hypothetical protein